jgi:hypothetical protein
MAEPQNADDVIDSRDVIETIAELIEQRESETDPWSQDDADYLATLEALADEASGYAEDWEYGETLIRDSYFEDYAMQLADDIGAIDAKAAWPLTCIDWEQAAQELQMDYTAVEFDGVTYWVR